MGVLQSTQNRPERDFQCTFRYNKVQAKHTTSLVQTTTPTKFASERTHPKLVTKIRRWTDLPRALETPSSFKEE